MQGALIVRMTDQIVTLAKIWCASTGLSLPRLATLVLNRGSFFDRMAEPGTSCNVETIERFLLFFRDEGKWPEGVIPDTALDLLDNFANIAAQDREAA